MPYVIKSEHTYLTAEGIKKSLISYFIENRLFNLMGSLEEAAKYDFITEARRKRRKYFANEHQL